MEEIEKTYNVAIDCIKQDINKPIGVCKYKIFDKLPADYIKNLTTKEELNMYIDINK